MVRCKNCWMVTALILSGLLLASQSASMLVLPLDVYLDKLHGAWQATMVANHTGLAHEGKYLDEPGVADTIELVLLEQWSTDDDTAVEWVDMHILETYGLHPTYAQIRAEWIKHLNHDIWVSTLKARQLMDQGVLPPDTGSAELNPEGVWSIDAQLQTELFGLIAPGLPGEARRRAAYFARVTNSGLAVQVSTFYVTLYALAFFEPHLPTLIQVTQAHFPADSQVNRIVDSVVTWHRRFPLDWRETRRRIRDAYDTDPEWWASKVNFASTIMALLYGDGDMIRTITIATLAGWDADNNATTSAGLLGVVLGYGNLPNPIRTASDLYFNEDVTGNLPRYETVTGIAMRTQTLGEAVIRQAGGWVDEKRDVYVIPVR